MADSEVDSREVDARFAVVKTLYEHMMDPNDFGAVRKRVEAVVQCVAELDSVDLDMAVEPFAVFVPEVAGE